MAWLIKQSRSFFFEWWLVLFFFFLPLFLSNVQGLNPSLYGDLVPQLKTLCLGGLRALTLCSLEREMAELMVYTEKVFSNQLDSAPDPLGCRWAPLSMEEKGRC